MLKLVYDQESGAVVRMYDGTIDVTEPFIEVSEQVVLDAQDKTMTVVNGELVLADPAPLPIADLKKEAISKLWRNYKTHQQIYVDPEDLTLAVVCAAKGSEKGTAVQMWVLTLWADYYEKKDAIETANTADEITAVNLVPAADNTPPYTIRELNDEAAAVISSATTSEKLMNVAL